MAKHFKLDRIGTFLAYGIMNIHQNGKEENIVAIQYYLDDLMVIKGTDVLKLFLILGMNSYSNLDLLEPYEFDMPQLNIASLENCYRQIKSNFQMKKKVFVDRQKPMKTIYLEPSPCSNVTTNPNCKAYCDWHENAVENLPSKIKSLLGYKTLKLFHKKHFFYLKSFQAINSKCKS